MFYLLMIPVCIMLLFELRYMRQLKKHDEVLYPFCHLRDDIIRFLFENRECLSRADYRYARHILEAVNGTVSLYRDHKLRFFNFRAFVRFVRQYRSSVAELAAAQKTENRVLNQFDERFSAAMSAGFLAYTPFLRSEGVARLLLLLTTILARLGMKRLSEARQFLTTVIEIAQEPAHPKLRIA